MSPSSDSLPVDVSVVILAKNEAHNIRRCIRAVAWASEVVVIDDHSTDRTRELAESLGARVLQREFVGFAASRNWAMEHGGLKCDWVLHLDADEEATAKFAEEVGDFLRRDAGEHSAATICRRTMMGRTWLRYSDGFPVWIMRLVRRGYACFEDQGHGEVAVPSVAGRMGKIAEPFLHHVFSRGYHDWISRHNRYSTREAMLEREMQGSTSVSSLFTRDRGLRRAALRSIARNLPCRLLLRFIYQYFWKLGLLDGRDGLRFCMLMAVYEWWICLKRDEPEAFSA